MTYLLVDVENNVNNNKNATNVDIMLANQCWLIQFLNNTFGM